MVSVSLEEIKREKFFVSKGFTDFSAYCESIGYSRRHANQLISDGTILKSLPENLRSLLQSERSIRELGKLPECLRLAVVSEASAGGKAQITSTDIKKATPPPRRVAAVKASSPPPRKPSRPSQKPAGTTQKDGTGLSIPKEALPLWNRMSEAQEPLTLISAVRGILRKAQEEKDPLFAEVDFTNNLAILNQLYADVQLAKPFAVCPECSGVDSKGCTVCRSRGFVSEFYWKHNVPEETKTLTGRK